MGAKAENRAGDVWWGCVYAGWKGGGIAKDYEAVSGTGVRVKV
ncbi:hypothetical protein [Nostoc sp. CALU 1950]